MIGPIDSAKGKAKWPDDPQITAFIDHFGELTYKDWMVPVARGSRGGRRT